MAQAGPGGVGTQCRGAGARRCGAGGLWRQGWGRLAGQDDEGVDVDSWVPGGAEDLDHEFVGAGGAGDHVNDLRGLG
jgi:hypothetical protein